MVLQLLLNMDVVNVEEMLTVMYVNEPAEAALCKNVIRASNDYLSPPFFNTPSANALLVSLRLKRPFL